MKHRRLLSFVCTVAAVLWAGFAPASAAAGPSGPPPFQAAERGDIVPLSQVLARIRKRCPGRSLDAHLDRGAMVYRIRWRSSKNRVLNVVADAATGRILSMGRC